MRYKVGISRVQVRGGIVWDEERVVNRVMTNVLADCFRLIAVTRHQEAWDR